MDCGCVIIHGYHQVKKKKKCRAENPKIEPGSVGCRRFVPKCFLVYPLSATPRIFGYCCAAPQLSTSRAVLLKMVPSCGNICILLIISVLGASHGVTVSPGGELTGSRAVISFAEHQTTEDRRVYLQGAQEKGYTCWMFPSNLEAAVCIQVKFSLADGGGGGWACSCTAICHTSCAALRTMCSLCSPTLRASCSHQSYRSGYLKFTRTHPRPSASFRCCPPQNPVSIYSDLPESDDALRLTLAKVSLRAWLPRFLCPSSPTKGEHASTVNSMVDHTTCLEVVEAAVAPQPDVELILTSPRQDTESETIEIR